MHNLIFIIKFLTLFTIITYFVLFYIMPQYTTGYNASIIDKYYRLCDINDPKIILVGDSNVAYGFDSEKIQLAFNMPVVNFGLHGGLGQTFHTDMIKKNINNGDVVIIVPDRYNYNSDKIRDNVLAWVTIENHFFLWDGISSDSYYNLLLAYPTYLKKALNLFITNKGNKPIEGTYSRASFNEYGDNIYPRPDCIMTEDRYNGNFNTKLSQIMKVYWNEYNKYVINKNATLYMSCPPILDKMLREDLESLQNQLEYELDFTMISQLIDYIYPLEYFYNTNLHLNDLGKDIRTQQFILDLKKYLK